MELLLEVCFYWTFGFLPAVIFCISIGGVSGAKQRIKLSLVVFAFGGPFTIAIFAMFIAGSLVLKKLSEWVEK